MKNSLFSDGPGVHVVVDGQFGSTGKGALASWLAKQAYDTGTRFSGVISNAGPNSGHTFYHDGEKHVLKQLPTFAVKMHLMGVKIPVFLSAGAVIDIDILHDEVKRYPGMLVHVHTNAAVLTDEDKASEHSGTVAMVAGTRSGTGAAIARKVLRDPNAVWGNGGRSWKEVGTYVDEAINAADYRYFMEVSQGFSLGINTPFMYPKVTSRECTVMQGIADSRIAPRHVQRTYMSVRTFPIRVGNVDGHSSGGWYRDQTEIQWEDIGVEPELTTVTQRKRRIATFSAIQFVHAMKANDPTHVFMNFMNYLDPSQQATMREELAHLRDSYADRWFDIIESYGPNDEDIQVG